MAMRRKELVRHIRKEAHHLEKYLICRGVQNRTASEWYHTLFLLKAAATALDKEAEDYEPTT